MDSLDIFQSSCRICLEKSAVLDWNEAIPDFGDTTYRCCYFLYTQLDDQDVFPQMLCETCASDLRNSHSLIQKALESHRILQQTLEINIEVDKDIHHQVQDTIDFETVFYKQSIESLKEVQNGVEENLIIYMDESSMEMSINLQKEHVDQKVIVENHNDDILPDDLEELADISQSTENLNALTKQDTKDLKKNKKNLKMCPYCSKFIRAEHIKLHEETHKADRKRTEKCPECGLELFTKRSMYSHMLTHKKNREKKYKCEFCEKSYFNRGGLTVHQRIHLGQMFSCAVCSKDYPRRIDLDKHNVKAHSAQPVLKTNYDFTKYLVECKDCGKSIRSHNWTHHRDTHLKKFQMKCTLCDKHFVNKTICHKHVKKVHKTDKKDYGEVVLYYGENIGARTSHLMIKQTEQLKHFS